MRFVIAFVGSILLAACVVPLRKTVYEPACIDGAGVSCTQRDDKLLIELPGGAKVHLEAGTYGEMASICMYVLLEHGSTFQFVSSNIGLESDTWSGARSISMIRGDKKISGVAGGAEAAGDVKTPGTETSQFWFWFKSAKGTLCETNIPAVAEFTLRIPDVLVNDQKMQIPPINFKTKKKWVVEGLCC